jgi:hypothetical protein
LSEIVNQLAIGSRQGKRQWYVNRQQQTLVILPGPVQFRMGSPDTEVDRWDREILHQRRIGRSFAIADTPVTVQQFSQFQEENRQIQRFDIARYAPDQECPQLAVDWYDAAAYCNWLSQKEGLPENQSCYQPNDRGQYAAGMKPAADYLRRKGYRLPTEAEWEYACRAGVLTARYFGESADLLGSYAWYLNTSNSRSWPVASLKPNEFGLFDMLGNAWEWCHEPYREYTPSKGSAPVDDAEDTSAVTDTDGRVLRGGAFVVVAANCRSATRNLYQATYRSFVVGFRLARTYD